MARNLIAMAGMCLLAVTLSAQQSTPSTEPDVILSIPDATKIAAWHDLRVQYTIVNGSNPSGIGVKSLAISLPSTLAVDSGTLGHSQDGALRLVTSPFQMRLPGEKREFPPIELRAKYLKEARSQLFSILTYRGQKETIVATLEYQPLSSPDVILTKTARLQVTVVPNATGIYVGALVGALLIALLIPANRLATQLAQAGKSQLVLRVELERFGARFGRGAVASAIAVLLLQTTSDFNFPISVGVQDFYGGVLLGLMGDKVVEQILSKTGLGSGRDSRNAAGAIVQKAAAGH